MTVKAKDIRTAIGSLGLSQQVVCVHSSLRSFGCVEGGAQTVIQVFLDEGCTVLVPSASWGFYAVRPKPHQVPERNGGSAKAWQSHFEDQGNDLPGQNRIYHPHTEEIDKGMGAIPAAVIARLDRVRGNHPLFSFAAVGPLAREIIDQQSAIDVFAPLRALTANNGYLVLMGVDLTKATFLHYAEEMAGRIPFRRWFGTNRVRCRLAFSGSRPSTENHGQTARHANRSQVRT